MVDCTFKAFDSVSFAVALVGVVSTLLAVPARSPMFKRFTTA